MRVQSVFAIEVVLFIGIGVARVTVHGGFEVLKIFVDALDKVVQLRHIVAQIAQFTGDAFQRVRQRCEQAGFGRAFLQLHAADQPADVADLFCQLCHVFTSAPRGS